MNLLQLDHIAAGKIQHGGWTLLLIRHTTSEVESCSLLGRSTLTAKTGLRRLWYQSQSQQLFALDRLTVFTRDSIYAVARICYGNSVCLSVCLSVTRVYCIQTAEHIIEILSLPDRPIILVFRDQGFLRKSDGFTPNGGAEYKGVAIFDQYAAISRKR